MSRCWLLALLSVALFGRLAPAQSPLEKDDARLPMKAVARYRPILADNKSPIIYALAWAPDGKTIAVVVAESHEYPLVHSVRLWDSSTSRLRADLGPGTAVAFSSDGKTVAWGDGWYETRIRDYIARQTRRRVTSGSVVSGVATNHVVLAADAKSLVTVAGINGGAGTRSLAVWDVATGKMRFQPDLGVYGFALSPDGKSLAVAGLGVGKAALAVKDIATGKSRWSGEISSDLWDWNPANQLAFSPDGKLLAWTGRNTLLFDAATGKERARLGDGKEYSSNLAFARNSKLLATLDIDRTPRQHIGDPGEGETIRVWDVETGKKTAEFPSHAAGTKAFTFSADGEMLITAAGTDWPGGKLEGGFKGFLRFWDVKTGKERRQVSAHAGGVNCLALSPDGKSLATGGGDGLVIIWKTEEK
ncbi:hypothetical protein AYO40_05580 [Planctomycetaceae bacterium SCGC AG-212-D15]|nr:hypothetical protein AYO40_05580 [Planctomycetaceae bacterium SCGC AG-212-D15]